MRTFVAIPIPAPVQFFIGQKQQQLEALLTSAHLQQIIRWTPPASVHLTLRFLGETTEQQCQDLQTHLMRLTLAQSPFALSLQEVGGFPTLRAPSIVWLGLRATADALLLLQQQVEAAAQASGFPAERKAFRPHLTIGRMKRQVAPPQVRAVGQWLTQHLKTTSATAQGDGTFVVDHLVHLQSQLQPAGPVYTPLQIFNFAQIGK